MPNKNTVKANELNIELGAGLESYRRPTVPEASGVIVHRNEYARMIAPTDLRTDAHDLVSSTCHWPYASIRETGKR